MDKKRSSSLSALSPTAVEPENQTPVVLDFVSVEEDLPPAEPAHSPQSCHSLDWGDTSAEVVPVAQQLPSSPVSHQGSDAARGSDSASSVDDQARPDTRPDTKRRYVVKSFEDRHYSRHRPSKKVHLAARPDYFEPDD